MSPPPPLTGAFEASPWRGWEAPAGIAFAMKGRPPEAYLGGTLGEAGTRLAQRVLDRAGPMRQQVKRLTVRVNSLMEVTRLEEGRPPLELETVEGSPP